MCVYACICMYGNRRKKPLGAFLNLIVLNSSWRQAALMAFFGSMRHVSHLEHLKAVMVCTACHVPHGAEEQTFEKNRETLELK